MSLKGSLEQVPLLVVCFVIGDCYAPTSIHFWKSLGTSTCQWLKSQHLDRELCLAALEGVAGKQTRSTPSPGSATTGEGDINLGEPQPRWQGCGEVPSVIIGTKCGLTVKSLLGRFCSTRGRPAPDIPYPGDSTREDS